VIFGISVTKTICKKSFHIMKLKKEKRIIAFTAVTTQYVFIWFLIL